MSIEEKALAAEGEGNRWLPCCSLAFRGLLWREWLAHGEMLLSVLAIWLVGGCVLLIFFHPGWVLGFGVLLAFILGHTVGGADASEGSEEFAFALPPTRGERYLARLAFAGGALAAFLVIGLVAIAADLPQVIWGLFVNSGFTEPFPDCRPRFLYAQSFCLPVAVFAFNYAIATAAGSRGTVAVAWLLAAVLAGALMGLGFLGEWMLWKALNGYISCPVLLALGAVGLQSGYLVYIRKEGISRPAPMRGATSWGLLVLGVVVIVPIFMFLLWEDAVERPAPPPKIYESADPQPGTTEVPHAIPVERDQGSPAAADSADVDASEEVGE